MKNIHKQAKLILITGGSGSGKSAYGEEMACKLGENGEKYYIATMQPFDEECRKRIERHRLLRADKGFETIEQYRNIEEAVKVIKSRNNDTAVGSTTVLLECMSNLLANEMYTSKGEKTHWAEVCDHIIDGIGKLQAVCGYLIIISNEVFSDGCDYDGETLSYICMLGEINKRIALQAEQVYEVVCGIPIGKK